ncbi:DUF3857 domain-containing protein [Solitalea sp. MAHUQ-68]|uniref:DUF3857 domain-containing protein n=1 Tax=Solitalea agri TaxID=2953739 RepID=A0A9X2F3C0_9SPHI|nr:DUF3857 domain-containing protein [Solitalea agri]MCO4293475.1 DUF3857 domain-containing protein [Solitalea agri]
MKKTLFLLLLCSLKAAFAYAGDERKYPVKDIPTELRKDADVVFRVDDVIFDIANKASAKYKYHVAITILNPNGDDRAELELGYDKLHPTGSIKGTLYDSLGNVIRKLKNSEIRDYKANDGVALYDDNRVKVAKLAYNVYPYTVDFEYEVQYVGLLTYPGWSGYSGYRASTQSSKYQLTLPVSMEVRYKESGLTIPLKKEVIDGKNSYTWQAVNLPALKQEPYSPSFREQGPLVTCGAVDISYEGYEGKMDTWNAFGAWYYNLNKDRDQLPEPVKTKVHELTDGLKDQIEKAKVLYDYLQKNTRYIGIQLGIGGFQTFDAKYVATRGYGDCKALTNYLKSLLKEAGVNANGALIYGGRQPSKIDPDFVTDPFNHVVLSIPTEKETYWVECTSQNDPLNYMGSFTGNRYALIFSPEGGQLVKTPSYSASDNTLSRNAKIKFDLSGQASAIVDVKYKCVRQDDLSYMNATNSKGEIEKYLYKTIDIPSMQLKGFSYQVDKESKPTLTEHLELEFSNYFNISGKRIFLQPNLFNRMTSLPEKLEKRRSEILFYSATTDEDNIVYEVPVGYSLESKPNDVSLKSEFGEFTASVKLENNQLIYSRKLIRNEGRFAPEKYNALLDFLTAIAKSDKAKVVLVTTGNPVVTN